MGMKPLPVPKSLCGRKCGGTVSLLLLWVKALEGKPKTPSSPQIMKLLSWEGQVPVQSTYVVPNETQGDPQPSRTLSLKLWGSHCPSPHSGDPGSQNFLSKQPSTCMLVPRAGQELTAGGAEGQSWVSALREAPFRAGGTQGGKNGGDPKSPSQKEQGQCRRFWGRPDQRPGRSPE